jgi:hypothetical protein
MKKKAGADRFFHCDFNDGIKLGEWQFQSGLNEVEAHFDLEEEGSIFLLIYTNAKALVKEYILNDKAYSYSWGYSETAYMSERGLQKAFRHTLPAGKHTVKAVCGINPDGPPEWAADIIVTLLYPQEKISGDKIQAIEEEILSYPKSRCFLTPEKTFSMDGYRQGVGGNEVSIGRFGYTKGDGVLDCAMTTLGSLNRMYLFGHPLYGKTTRWQYSLLPKGIDREKKYHGSFPPAQVGIDQDEIEITYLGSLWKTTFQRPGSCDVNFACTYSLGSAGILIETDDCQLSLSELQYAGNYTRVLLPLEKGLMVRDISTADFIYDRSLDGELKANWFLIYGASSFPDIPIQVVMTRKPEEITIIRRDGLLNDIDVKTEGAFGVGFAVSPFGIKAFSPGDTLHDSFAEKAYDRCDFWSRAVLAYPVDAEEYYKIDDEAEKVKIVQKYKYRFIQDEWGTTPLKTAPLPPVLNFCTDLEGFTTNDNSIDFQFPTKYGYLKGLVNSNTSNYELPFIPERRRIDFRPAGDNTIAHELAAGVKEYWEFMEKFDNDEFPLSPYCASYLERYRFVCSMLNYLPEPYRDQLLVKLRENLPLAIDPNRSFKLVCGVSHASLSQGGADTETVAKLFKSEDVSKKTFYNWYERKEPITGNTYKLTYVNCGVANSLKDGSKDVIEKQLADTPMIEVDWGTGLSLNAIALSTLATGDWEGLQKNWDTLRSAFKYFHLYQDWACMSASYAENGGTWIEGANYNGFIGFCRMAESLNNLDDLALGRYLGAKQGACRLAIFRSSYHYFPEFFHRSPWFLTKHFHDEVSPGGAFQNAPDPGVGGEDFRLGGFFNLATEGAYPETYALYLKHIPDEFFKAWSVYRENLSEVMTLGLWPTFAIVECHAGYLLSLALHSHIRQEKIDEEIVVADRMGIMLRKWFGLHYPVRRLPENCYQSYLKSIIVAKDYPVWLEHWSGLEFPSATYDAAQKEATIQIKVAASEATIECGAISPPKSATLNGNELPFSYNVRKKRLTFSLLKSGRLVLKF